MSEPRSSTASLRTAVRRIARALDTASHDEVRALVAPLRAFVQPNVHVGRTDMTPDEVVEWYAGQILDIVDEEKWFAVNSWINCRDKFAPELP